MPDIHMHGRWNQAMEVSIRLGEIRIIWKQVNMQSGYLILSIVLQQTHSI